MNAASVEGADPQERRGLETGRERVTLGHHPPNCKRGYTTTGWLYNLHRRSKYSVYMIQSKTLLRNTYNIIYRKNRNILDQTKIW